MPGIIARTMVRSLAFNVFKAAKLLAKYREKPSIDRMKKTGNLERNCKEAQSLGSRTAKITHSAAVVAHSRSPTACITGMLPIRFLDNSQLTENSARIAKVNSNNRPFKAFNEATPEAPFAHTVMPES